MTTPIAQLPPEKVQELIEDRRTQAEANKVPFPGAARVAFAPPQPIEVGRFKVRPFYDGDLDILQALNHPLHKFAFDQKDGEMSWGEDLRTVRGQMAWNLCYLMTTPVEGVEHIWETNADPIAMFEKLAKKEFRLFQLVDLVNIQKAAFAQFNAYFGAVIGYDAADAKGQQKKMSSTEGSASPTDSAGVSPSEQP